MEKVQQIEILQSKDCVGTFYSWQTYINERLRVLHRQEMITQVRVVYASADECVIAYLIALPREEI